MTSSSENNSPTQIIRRTWESPSDTLSILLLVGGDVIAKSMAQLTGPTIVPVAFSFGWVAYSFTTLMTVFGNGCLLVPPDYPAKVYNVASGIPRENRSWVIGRFLRDIERPLKAGVAMNITIFTVVGAPTPSYDWCYWSGITTIVIQLGISVIPYGLYGDWSIFFVTGIGTMLALLTGSIPQWRLEKYPGRRLNKKNGRVVAITGGNGSRNVIVVIDGGEHGGINLEDLAASQPPMLRYGQPGNGSLLWGVPIALRVTQLACALLAICWMILLITVTGLHSQSWYLLLVGGIGMLQNVIVAGAPRSPAANMLRLEKVDEIQGEKVMHALMEAEEAYPGLGRILLPEFFSVEILRNEKKTWWGGDGKIPYPNNRSQKSGGSRPTNTPPKGGDGEDSTPFGQARSLYRRIIQPVEAEMPAS